MKYYIYLFANIVTPLYPWDESLLIIVYDLCNVLLDAVFQYFVENFRVLVHQQYWPVVFFICFVFIWLGDKNDSDFVKRVWESSHFLRISK